MEGVIKVADVDELTIEEAVLLPAKLLRPLLRHQKCRSELIRLDLEEASQLVEVHSSVEPQVGLDGRSPHIGLDLIHEDGEVVLNGVDVGLRVVEIRGHGRDELRAGGAEELLKDGKRLRSTTLQLEHLVAVLLAKGAVDSVIQPCGVESHADSNERVHLLIFLGDGVVLRVLLEILGTRHVDEDVAEHLDGIGVAVHHHVGETNVIVRGEVCSHDASEHGLLVELDVVEGLEGEAEVTQQAVHTEQANDGEVAEHAVEVLGTVVACNSHRILVALGRSHLLGDLGTLNQGVQHVKNAVASPSVGVLAEDLHLLLVRGLSRDARAV